MVSGAAAVKIPPIHRIGGKYRLMEWLLPLIPYCESSVYIEPFFGSGVVLLNRRISRLEVANDLDSLLIRFMRVLQKPEERARLLERLQYTLYSKEEFDLACSKKKHKEYTDDVDFAWVYFVSNKQAFCGYSGTWGRAVSVDKKKTWGTTFRWFSGISCIDFFVNRISVAQIENDTAVNIIRRYDSAAAIFYCDPPYLLETRVGGAVYENEMTLAEHEELLRTLLQCKGAVCISGYASELYSDMLAGWQLSSKTVQCQLGKNAPKAKGDFVRTECLWRNAKAMEYFDQQTLF